VLLSFNRARASPIVPRLVVPIDRLRSAASCPRVLLPSDRFRKAEPAPRVLVSSLPRMSESACCCHRSIASVLASVSAVRDRIVSAADSAAVYRCTSRLPAGFHQTAEGSEWLCCCWQAIAFEKHRFSKRTFASIVLHFDAATNQPFL
jgi:hypothetical protein